jgi:hypothetical protein
MWSVMECVRLNSTPRTWTDAQGPSKKSLNGGGEAVHEGHRACAESKEVNQALVNHVWGVCDAWSAELIPQICPKSWPSMVERQNGPYEWSPPF